MKTCQEAFEDTFKYLDLTKVNEDYLDPELRNAWAGWLNCWEYLTRKANNEPK